jgi:hypothetical protein
VLAISTRRYLGLDAAPAHLREQLAIRVTAHTFAPRADDLLADWVSTIAAPAFKLIRRREGPKAAFASIGTGAGLDALAAVELLGSTQVGVTDVHEDVVATAVANIRDNLVDPRRLALESGAGDLLSPLAAGGVRYDLIYENLPNVPVADAAALATGRVSSGHVPPRPERIPALFHRNLLALHYVALLHAKNHLAPGGSVLSMLGARIPLGVYYELSLQAGYRPEIFTYGWKVQAEPGEMLRGHLAQEQAGLGPYHFYPAPVLSEVFQNLSLEDAAARAFEIEQTLAPHRLSSGTALAAHQRGEVVAHTTVALRSSL